jgi:hypothetical protein
LIDLRDERGGIKQAVLEKRWHELDDDAAEVFWCEGENVSGRRE